jgi:hypothetical protein
MFCGLWVHISHIHYVFRYFLTSRFSLCDYKIRSEDI